MNESPRLRVLLVEDSAEDAELILRAMRGAGLELEPRVVADEVALRAALTVFVPQLVLVDWTVPGFSGAAAAIIAREWDARVPLILVSGTVGDQLVVQGLRIHATDYVSKRHLEALGPAVRRAVREEAARRDQARLAAELAAAQDAVRASEERLRASLDAMHDPFLVCSAVRDEAGTIRGFRVTYANSAAAVFMGQAPDRFADGRAHELPLDLGHHAFSTRLVDVVETGQGWSGENVAVTVPGPAGAGREATVNIQIAKTGDGLFAVWQDVTERRRLALERERLAAAVEQATSGMVITDPELRVAYANAAYAVSVGREPSELVGLPVREVASIGLDPTTVSAMAAAVEAGQPWASEADHRFPDGSVHRFDISVHPVHDAGGAIAGWVSEIRDVTKRHVALREMHRLSSAIEQSPDGVIIVGADLRIAYANMAFAADLGGEPSALVRRNVFEVLDGVLDAPTIAALAEVARAAGPWLGEVPRRLADGTVGPVQIRVTPLHAADGALQEYVVTSRDVSELRATQAERDRLATAVEQAADFVVVNDRDGVVQTVNPAFERLTGYPADEARGRSVASLLRSGADAPAVYAMLDDALRRGDVWSGHLAERRADGSLLDVDLSISPIRDATGALIGTVEIGRDRTRERELERQAEREAQIRAALTESLARTPADATLEQAAQAVCDVLVTLPSIDVAEVQAFVNDRDVVLLAVAAPPGYPAVAGTHLPAIGAARVRERTGEGPWAAFVADDPAGGWIPGAHAAGLRALAYGPVVHGADRVGALAIGTFDAEFAQILVEQMPGVVVFSATASARLAEHIHRWRLEVGLRAALRAALSSRSFHPVFQPIVDLGTGEALGYEALTRFDSGQRPDLCFADAWSVGLGPDLELATLEVAVAAGQGLPAGRWLDLNVSPRLLADPGRLAGVLRGAGRPLVLEITEHEVIDDYGALREAIRPLGNDVRVAVDDAGAGVANFGHIIELGPDFVKLDISLVRRVNANMGRQAMVVGMRHFSRTAGCRLIAEGVETEEEAATLRGLGVEFGQGYHFGRPAPAANWSATPAAGSEASQLTPLQNRDG